MTVIYQPRALRRSSAARKKPDFTPKNLPGLCVWFDLQNTASLTIDGSTNLEAIVDASNSGNDAEQTDSGDRPAYQATGVNSLPAGYSDGSTDMKMTFNMPVSVGEDFTANAVVAGDTSTVDPSSGSSLNGIFSGSSLTSSDSYIGMRQTSDAVDGSDHNELRTVGSGGGYTATFSGAGTMVQRWDQSTLDTFVDGTLEEQESTSTTTQTVTGGTLFGDSTSSRAFVGWIQELVISCQWLDTAWLDELQDYQENKWGLV